MAPPGLGKGLGSSRCLGPGLWDPRQAGPGPCAQDMRAEGAVCQPGGANGQHAVFHDRHQGVIGLLREAGACLSSQELEDAGTELCR
jgi:hypothetical protein